MNRIQQKVHAEATRPTDSYKLKPLDDIFQGDLLEKAEELEKREFEAIEDEPEMKKRKISETNLVKKTKKFKKNRKEKVNIKDGVVKKGIKKNLNSSKKTKLLKVKVNGLGKKSKKSFD